MASKLAGRKDDRSVKAALLRIGVLVLPLVAGAVSWVVAVHLTDAIAVNVSKSALAGFTLLIGFAMFMLKEVQQIVSKGVLSDVGLDRLRRVQKVAQVRTLLLIGIGALGLIAASFSTFLQSEVRFVRIVCFVIALCALIVLFVFSVTYLPMLFFDLQRARDKLDDLKAEDALRKRQIEALNSGRGSGA